MLIHAGGNGDWGLLELSGTALGSLCGALGTLHVCTYHVHDGVTMPPTGVVGKGLLVNVRSGLWGVEQTCGLWSQADLLSRRLGHWARGWCGQTTSLNFQPHVGPMGDKYLLARQRAWNMVGIMKVMAATELTPTGR